MVAHSIARFALNCSNVVLPEDRAARPKLDHLQSWLLNGVLLAVKILHPSIVQSNPPSKRTKQITYYNTII